MFDFMLDEQYSVNVRWLGDEATGFKPRRHVALCEAEVPQGGIVWGLGSDQNRTAAERIARSELVEHFALADAARHRMRFGQAAEHGIDPRNLRELTQDQAVRGQLAIYDPTRQYYWLEGKDIVSGRAVEILADFCIAPFNPGSYPQRIAWGNSSGMAAHTELSLAQRSALLELFERDALMVTWMANFCPPYVPASWWPEMAAETIGTIEQLGYSVYVLDLTCRNVPVVMAIAERDRWPALSVGLAARESMVSAIDAAVRELEVNLLWHFTAGRTASSACVDWRPPAVLGVGGHEPFYAQPRNRHYAAFLWTGRKVSKRSPTATSRFLTAQGFNVRECCRSLGLDNLYQVDYPPVYGLPIVRFLTASLVPISFGYDQFPLKHPARLTPVFPADDSDNNCQDVTIPHPLA